MNPDQLLDEGKEDIVKACSRLMNSYNWLQGRNPEGGELSEGVGKRVSRDSAITIHGLMRGFYTHNGLVFPKGCRVPKRTGSKVSQRDDKDEIYGYDEESDSMTYNSDRSKF